MTSRPSIVTRAFLPAITLALVIMSRACPGVPEPGSADGCGSERAGIVCVIITVVSEQAVTTAAYL